MVSRVGKVGLSGVKVVGAIMTHPFFGGTEGEDMWMYMCPENKGLQDPRMKPDAEDLKRLGCERVLVFGAEKDSLFNCARNYVEELKKSGWGGKVEIVENWGLEHCFHVGNPKEGRALEILQKYVSFINQE